MKRSLVLLVSALVASTLCAQVTTNYRTIPDAFTGVMAGSANLAPLARTKVFMQTWYDASNLGPVPLLEMGFRLSNNANGAAMQQKMEITLCNTTATFSTLSTTFANNLTKPTVFVAMKTINFPAATPNTDPNKAVLWVKGDTPFVFLGPHLIVQFDVQTAATPGSNGVYYVDAYSMNSVTTTIHTSQGSNCTPASLTASNAGNTWKVDVSGAPASSPVIYMIGFSKTRFAGAVPLPLDLSGLGMPGCTVDIDPLLFFPFSTNASGQASVSLPYTTTTGVKLVPMAQCIVADSSKPVGFATTNAATSILNGTGLSTYLYNWTAFGPTAQYGPYTTNRGACLLFKP